MFLKSHELIWFRFSLNWASYPPIFEYSAGYLASEVWYSAGYHKKPDYPAGYPMHPYLWWRYRFPDI
jgi:hypothetical protein